MIKYEKSNKPYTVQTYLGRTKREVMGIFERRTGHAPYTIGGMMPSIDGTRPRVKYSCRIKDGFAYLANYQKFRRKCVQPPQLFHTIDGTRLRETYTKGKAKVIRESHWELRIYKVLLSRVILAKQNDRNFELILTQ